MPEASNEKVDGEKTQGENIGDLGGVKEAFLVRINQGTLCGIELFKAFQNHIRQTGPEPPLPGLERYAPQQLFFLAMARVNTTSRLLCRYQYSSDILELLPERLAASRKVPAEHRRALPEPLSSERRRAEFAGIFDGIQLSYGIAYESGQ